MRDALLGRDVAAVDEDGEALGGPQRRHHPIAAAECGSGAHERFASIVEGPVEPDAAIGIRGGGNRAPGSGSGRGDRRGMCSGRDLFDQLEFPGAAFDLPDAQRHEPGEQQQRDQACDVDGRARSRVHHMSAAACIGIMFVFMWYITQIDPLSVMTTRMIVKISAIIVQPPSDLPLMCRK